MEPDKTIATVDVALSTETDKLSVKTAEGLTAVVPIDLDVDDLTFTYDLPESVRAPISANEKIGSVIISYGNTVYGEIDLIALNSISMSNVLYYKDKLDNFFQSTLFRVTVFVLIVFFAFCVVLRMMFTRRRAARRRAMMRNRSSRSDRHADDEDYWR